MKIKQVVGVGLCVAMVGVLVCSGIVLSSALSRTEEVAQRRDNTRQRLEYIYNERIFPSEIHAALIREEAQYLTAWKTNFVETQRAAFQVETRLSPSQFKLQVLQPAIRELSQAQTEGGTRIVPDGFAFGFEAYIPGDKKMPDAADVPKLAVQFELIRRLCQELFASNIIALRQVQRLVFETAAVPEVPSAPAGKKARLVAAAAAAAAVPAVAQNRDPRALTGQQPFTFEFTARKDALLTVLNRLAVCDLFVVVKELEIRKVGMDVKAPPQKWREMRDAPHQRRVVSAPEMDAPMMVRMTLAVEIF